MRPDQEANLKMQAEKLAYMNQAQTVGMAGCASDSPSREPLLGRLYRQASHAQQEARRAERTHELIGLLEKHPEVARILDLVEELGRY